LLKNVENEWVREEQPLKEMTEIFFKNLYESVRSRNFQPILHQIPTSIDETINQRLVEPITMEEITAAMQQLGATKALGPDGLNGLFFQNHWPNIC